jgi:nucleoside-diphosphate-sugar epimerase
MIPMEILVTGASGFVGRGLLETLSAAGHSGTATGRTPPVGLPHGWRACSRNEILAGAVEVPRPEGIVHLEVEQLPTRRLHSAGLDYDRVNVAGTRDWLDWAAVRGVRRFVFTSSIKAAARSPGIQTEEAALESGSTYGGSKARAEAEIRLWADAVGGRSAVILRPAPVYGPESASNLVSFARLIKAGRPCLVGSGATRKSVVSRRNLTAAILFALSFAGSGCSLFNVSDPRTLSLEELADLIAALAHAPAPRRIPRVVARLAAPIGDVLSAVTGHDMPMTTARLRAIDESEDFPADRLVAAGFVPPQTTREGLAEMLAWMEGDGPG